MPGGVVLSKRRCQSNGASKAAVKREAGLAYNAVKKYMGRIKS